MLHIPAIERHVEGRWMSVSFLHPVIGERDTRYQSECVGLRAELSVAVFEVGGSLCIRGFAVDYVRRNSLHICFLSSRGRDETDTRSCGTVGNADMFK